MAGKCCARNAGSRSIRRPVERAEKTLLMSIRATLTVHDAAEKRGRKTMKTNKKPWKFTPVSEEEWNLKIRPEGYSTRLLTDFLESGEKRVKVEMEGVTSRNLSTYLKRIARKHKMPIRCYLRKGEVYLERRQKGEIVIACKD